MKDVSFATSALKEMMAITPVDRERILSKLKQYAADPSSLKNQVKMLKGASALRLRVGDYRAVFQEEKTRLVVLRVGHRREVYD